VAKLFGQVLDAAGAGGGIRHLGEVRFLEQHKLSVTGNPAREAIGQAERHSERQHADGVGAGEARRDDSDCRSQHVHVGIAPAHHPPGGLGGDEGGSGRKPAGFLDSCPQPS
jgi:hypothetical protein